MCYTTILIAGSNYLERRQTLTLILAGFASCMRIRQYSKVYRAGIEPRRLLLRSWYKA